MSCKVLRGTVHVASPMFSAPSVRPATAAGHFPEGNVQRSGRSPGEEIAALTGRVHQLETDLREKVEEARLRGEQTGYQRAVAEQQEVLSRLSKAILDISGLRKQIREEAESEMVALSMAIARRVLHRELTVDPDAVLGLLRAALARVKAREITRIRTHAAHEEALRHALRDESGITVEPDSSLRLGDILVETARGTLDASVNGQLLEIERGFADRLRG